MSRRFWAALYGGGNGGEHHVFRNIGAPVARDYFALMS
jgi:hypothetical protein